MLLGRWAGCPLNCLNIQHMKNLKLRTEERVFLIYLVSGAAWILLTDKLLALFFSDLAEITLFQTYKGWIFVIASGLVIYYFLHRSLSSQRSTAASVREHEERYRLLFDTSLDAIMLTGPDGSIYAANPAACRLFERSELEICQVGRQGVIDTRDPRLAAAIEERSRTGKFFGELNFLTKSGVSYPCEVSSAVFTDTRGQLRTSMIIRDLRERDRNAEIQRQNAQKFSILFARSAFAALLTRPDNIIEEVNDEFENMFGYTKSEVIGKTAQEINIQPSPPDLEIISARLQKDNSSRSQELTIHTKAGVPLRLLVNVDIVHFGEAVYYLSTMQDITERKRMEEKILRVNRLYATLGQINQAIVHQKDRDRLFADICRVAIDYGHYRMAWIGLIDPQDQSVKPVAFAGEENGYLSSVSIQSQDSPLGRGPTGTAVREGQCVVCQDISTDPRMIPWREQALSRGYRSSASIPIRQSGAVIGALAVYGEEPYGFDVEDENLLRKIEDDISFALDALAAEADRARKAQALENSERKFSILFNKASLPAVLSRYPRHEYVDVNEAWLDLFGFTKNEVIEKTSVELGVNRDQVQRERTIQQVFQKHSIQNLEQILYTKGGRPLTILTNVNWVEIEGQNYAITSIQDITDRKKAEGALLESEERYRNLLDTAPVGIAVHSEGKIVFANPAGAHMIGAESPDQVVGKSILEIIHPAGLALSIDRIKKLQAGVRGLYPTEDTYLKLDGSLLYVEVMATLIRYNGKPAVQVIIADITDRKQKEEDLRASSEQIRLVTARLAENQEIERRAIAKELHDRVGQGLTALGINLGLIRQKLEKERLDEAFPRLDSAQNIVNEVTDQIREVMAELHPPVLEDYGLAAALRWLADRLYQQVGMQIDVTGEQIDPRIPQAQSIVLYRIAQEALTNIIKYAGTNQAAITLKAQPDWVILTIADQGIGFNPSEPFSLLKPHWGLLLMRERAESVRGDLTIESVPGKGTIVQAKIPR